MVFFLYFFSLVLMVHVTVSDLVGHYGNVVRWCNDNGLSCKDADPFTGKWVLTQEDESQFTNARNDWNFTTPDSRYFNVDLSSGITVSHRNSNGHIIKENKFVWSCQCGATQADDLELCSTDINGLSLPLSNYTSCGNLTGSLIMTTQTELLDLTPLRLVFIGGDVNLNDNNALTSLVGLDALISIGGYLNIDNNNALPDLVGLGALISIGKDLRITRNDESISLTGLDALTSVGGDLYISNNYYKLASLAGLGALISIGGGLYITYNSPLLDLDGFGALRSIGGNLEINDNSNLASLDGFGALRSIGGNLEINKNTNLASLDGFGALISIGGYLDITNNGELSSLNGFEALEFNNTLTIENNNLALTQVNLTAFKNRIAP